MKWAAIISFVIVLSLTESRNLQKRDHHEGHHDHEAKVLLIGDAFTLLGADNFKAVALVLFSQNLQKCPFAEHVQRVKEVVEIAERCSKGIKTAQCGKSVTAIVLDEMCKTPENAEKYPFHQSCCAKQDPDRHECFVEHKLTAHDAIPAYQKPTPEQVCKDYHDNKEAFVGNYLYQVAIRNPLVYPPALLHIAHGFEHIAADCCKETTTCGQCLAEKMPALKKELKMIVAIQNHNCYISKDFDERTLHLVKLVLTSQRFPKAEFKLVEDLVHDIVHLTKTCCSGDMIACMADRLALTTKTCAKKDELSSKLTECCEKDIIERSACIVKLDNDERPADLSPEAREYIDDVLVCKKFETEQGHHINHFAYDFARRHPELSVQINLQITNGYGTLLPKCCAKGDDTHACLVEGEAMMKKEVQSCKEFQKTNCDALEKLGSYHFHNLLLSRYTPKMPQATTPALIELTDAMTHVGEHCCKLPAEKQIPCSEGALALIIGDFCQKQEGHFVNNQVSHCCRDSYADQRSCFSSLGPDPSYVPPEPSADYFNFNEKLCGPPESKELEVLKETFLVNLLKLKPKLKDDELKQFTGDFLAMTVECCKGDHDHHVACFAVEGPKLITKCQGHLALQVAV